MNIHYKHIAIEGNIGSGKTTYSNYDIQIAKDAKNWIANRKKTDKPWVLFVYFVFVHTYLQ